MTAFPHVLVSAVLFVAMILVVFGGLAYAWMKWRGEAHLGTARIVANSAGTPVDDSDFYPFGGERIYLNSSPQNYKFTGKERDAESGLDNFGARHNSSGLGRFMSADPKHVSAHLFDPQSFNRYTYTRNNPLAFVDPDGRDLQKAWQDLKIFAKSLYIKTSIGLGYEVGFTAGTAKGKIGAAYKASIEASGDGTSKASRSLDVGISGQLTNTIKAGENVTVEQATVKNQRCPDHSGRKT